MGLHALFPIKNERPSSKIAVLTAVDVLRERPISARVERRMRTVAVVRSAAETIPLVQFPVELEVPAQLLTTIAALSILAFACPAAKGKEGVSYSTHELGHGTCSEKMDAIVRT